MLIRLISKNTVQLYSNFTNAVKTRILNYIRFASISMLLRINLKKWVKPSSTHIDLISRSELMQLDVGDIKLLNEYDKMNKDWNLGLYKSAVDLRHNLMREVYRKYDLDNSHFPPFLPPNFFTNAGHFAIYLMHVELRRFGSLGESFRTNFVPNSSLGMSALRLFDTYPYRNIKVSTRANMGMAITSCNLFENLESFKMSFGFQDLYQVIEDFFIARRGSARGFDSLLKAFEHDVLLRELGLKSGTRFITVHCRDFSEPSDIRSFKTEDLSNALSSIDLKGMYVVQIGHRGTKPLSLKSNFINISNMPFDTQIKAMAYADFHVGGTSGMTLLAQVLGTRTISINVTAIGRNMNSSNIGSYCLPKRVIISGRELSLSEILAKNIAYAEGSILENYPELTFKSRTSREIAEAISLALDYSSTIELHKIVEKSNLTVRTIQDHAESVAKGNISPSLLVSDPNLSR